MVRAELELARTYQAETNDALRLERMSKGPADELLGKSGRRITELEAELAKAVKSTIGQIADALEHKIGDARSVKLAQWIRDERWK